MSIFYCTPKLVKTTVHPACDNFIACSTCILSLLGMKGVTFCQESSYILYFQISLRVDKITILSRPGTAILQLYWKSKVFTQKIINKKYLQGKNIPSIAFLMTPLESVLNVACFCHLPH